MSLAKVRVAGAWVDSPNFKGAVRVGGSWVDFGPSGATYERLTFPDPPTLLNGNDSNQDYNLGLRFSVDVPSLCYGVSWIRTPNAITSTPSGGSHVAALWSVDTEARLEFKNFTPVAASDNQDVLFDTPFSLSASPTLYVISIFTRDYVYRASGGVELVSPSGNIQADVGRLSANVSPLVYPSNAQAAYYYISPLVGV